jgi:hypothetical protein
MVRESEKGSYDDVHIIILPLLQFSRNLTDLLNDLLVPANIVVFL